MIDAPTWPKSSYSGSGGGNCVEIGATALGAVQVRDSKDPSGPMLAFGPSAWAAFAAKVKTTK